MPMEIPFTGRVHRDIKVPMRDGVEIAVDLYLPANTDGPLPALFAMSPYGKNAQRQILPAPVESRITDLCAEAGWSQDLVDAGYAHVVADTRGSGNSGGTYLGMYTQQESLDGYDLVEWIAAQDWCDGKVGMLGISYFGSIQLVVAASQPPHLKAIAPLEATTDQYQACYHGGVLDGFYSELPHGGMTNNTGSGMDLADPRSWTLTNLGEHETTRRVEQRLTKSEMAQYSMFRSILENPRRNTIFFDNMLNEHSDSDYWWSPDLSAITIPVLCGAAWYPDCGPKFVRGPAQIWEGVSGPKKMLMTKAGWLERPYSQFHELLIRWFDHWLKGVENGVMDEPPIELYVNGAEQVRRATEWPLPETEWTSFYLGTHRRLSSAAQRFDDLEPDGYVQQPPLLDRTLGGLAYSTGPLPAALEITGPVALYLHASLDATDGWFKATLVDVAPDGSRREVSHGHLRCSHRALDAEKSREFFPVHPHTEDATQPVEPGVVDEYAIEIYPVSHLFDKGHELVIEISSGDLPGEGFSFHLMAGETITYKIYRDASRPSRLVVPVIPDHAPQRLPASTHQR